MTQPFPIKQFWPSVVFAFGAMVCKGHVDPQNRINRCNGSRSGPLVALADVNQAECIWTASIASMQKSISQEGWTKYVNNLRNNLGSQDGPEWAEVVLVGQPAHLLKGNM
ncbi:MAG: DUF4019 domain-containing protein [Glaciimonas sp.]|nr:DUF4019 domain-containing protein [Glaciimonas sp.]